MADTDRRRLGLAPLSLIDVDPPTLIDLAADAGFDFVGIRVRAVTSAETPFDLSLGSPLLAATVERLADRGVPCLDTEFILLDGRIGPAEWLPALESAASLGAATMTVAINDPQEGRILDGLRLLVADASRFGVECTIEPISYNAVCSLPAAQALAEQVGCGVLIDTLHVARGAATAAEITEVAALVPMIQLCDGPAARPADRDALVHESRAERMAPGTGGFPLELYLASLPADLPVSVEVPSASLRRDRTPAQYVGYLRERAEAVLAADLRNEGEI